MSNTNIIEAVGTRILEIRGKKVMLDSDLAKLYGVEVKRLNEQVKRNKKRFPVDFMFQVTAKEFYSSRSQFATLKQGKNIKYLPYVFTEPGVAMLSSVLNSERAIQVNILIIRAFIKLREIFLTHKDLAIKVEKLEKKYAEHDETIREIFEAVRKLLEPPAGKERIITGFSIENKRKNEQ